MRILITSLLVFLFTQVCGQFPYVKKLNYPEQLPTQVVYDMLADSKGYIWIGTDRGLYRFNGRTFVAMPFNNTSLKSVSYLQEDNNGTIWCMNFYNQLFYCHNDTLKLFEIDRSIITGANTFHNVVIGAEHVYFNSFNNIYRFDKASRKIVQIINCPTAFDPIMAAALSGGKYYACSLGGSLYSQDKGKEGWTNIQQNSMDMRLIKTKSGVIGLAIGMDRINRPFEIKHGEYTLLKPISLEKDAYIFQGATINDTEHWLCTQKGAYYWNKNTGETKCYLPNERVTDVVKDYQGNYWISTLDNGVFICSSLDNTLLKVYNDPLLDNFSKLLVLPDGQVLTGNSQGLLSKINLSNREVFNYDLPKEREAEFISYDTARKIIIVNRGVFALNKKEPLGQFAYSKGVDRDRFGNMLVAVFNGALVVNDRYASNNRIPRMYCPLYRSGNIRIIRYDYNHWVLQLRAKRSIAVLASRDEESFWVAYEDGVYQYYYSGKIKILEDPEGKPVIGKSMFQLPDGSMVVGTSMKGVMIFKNGKVIKIYNEKDGLSGGNVRKLFEQGKYIWVLTDAGLDRIDMSNGFVTNYLEEYGLSNIIINDFSVQNDQLLFATPTGILLRNNTIGNGDFSIRFPLLKAVSSGTAVTSGSVLPGKARDITFHFEALHYISPAALTYQYRLREVDTVWRYAGNFNNQISYNRLSPGKYLFEIRAFAGANYKSAVRMFSFVIPKPFWQKWWFWALAFVCLLLIARALLLQWKINLLKRQTIKEQLLKSQLVALRAQMNPHFLYNVLNTVQGLVYGNRKAEAGQLLGNFSDLMRKVLQSSDKQMLPLSDEIENIRLYLELEKARFDEGFSYTIEMNDMEDAQDMYVPSLLLQPFAENAVKHGLMHKNGSKRLLISFAKQGGGLLVIIEDNGVGRKRSMEINQRNKNKPSGFATIALNERIELFNRLYKKKITCEIMDITGADGNPAGTRIRLEIPNYSSDRDVYSKG